MLIGPAPLERFSPRVARSENIPVSLLCFLFFVFFSSEKALIDIASTGHERMTNKQSQIYSSLIEERVILVEQSR